MTGRPLFTTRKQCACAEAYGSWEAGIASVICHEGTSRASDLTSAVCAFGRLASRLATPRSTSGWRAIRRGAGRPKMPELAKVVSCSLGGLYTPCQKHP